MPIVKVNSLDRVKKVLAKVHVPAVLIFVILFWSSLATAQITPGPRPTPTPPQTASQGTLKGDSDDTPLTTFEEELRAKRAIKLAEKDHEENLKRAREIAEIGKELNDVKDKSVLDRDSLKKVERLEKLTKKVRGEAGGDDEEVEIPNRPADLPATLAQIAEASESLSKKVIDTPRQVVSASVIGKANVLLELIKMVRGFARP